jgi:hypothetical protein
VRHSLHVFAFATRCDCVLVLTYFYVFRFSLLGSSRNLLSPHADSALRLVSILLGLLSIDTRKYWWNNLQNSKQSAKHGLSVLPVFVFGLLEGFLGFFSCLRSDGYLRNHPEILKTSVLRVFNTLSGNISMLTYIRFMMSAPPFCLQDFRFLRMTRWTHPFEWIKQIGLEQLF